METKVIGFDLNGADLGIDAIIEGLSLYLAETKTNNTFRLFGDENEAKAALEKFNLTDNSQIEIFGTTQVVENSESPARAVIRKKDASVVVGANQVKNGDIDCFVSSGSTGALVAAAVVYVKMLPGIERPALGGLMPSTTKDRPTLIMDLGANVDTKPEHLLQYGRFGSQFMKSVYNIESPKVGLVNIGAEDGKGNDLYKESFKQLKADEKLNFTGNLEARDVITTDNDVLVIDGFSGNILLKSIEGTVAVFNDQLKKTFLASAKSKLGALLVKNGLKQMKSQFDYRELGATPIFGTQGLMLKAHGSSDPKAFKNAFRSAEELVNSNFIENLTEGE